MKKRILTLIMSALIVFGVNAQRAGVFKSEKDFKQALKTERVAEATNSVQTHYSSAVKNRSWSNDLEDQASAEADFTIINNGDPKGFEWKAEGGHEAPGCFTISFNSEAHDDWLVTPQLTGVVAEAKISFWAKHANNSWPEIFDVMLSTGGNNPEDFTVTLASNVLPTTAYEKQEFDLSAYAGQDIYVAIHTTTQDMWKLFIDDFKLFLPLAHDLKPLSFDSSAGTINVGESFVPKVTIANVGTNNENAYSVNFKITKSDDTEVYNQTISVNENIAAFGGTKQIIFPEWISLEGEYNISTSVDLSGDLDNSNDTLTSSFECVDMTDFVFGQVIYATEGLNKGLYAFNPNYMSDMYLIKELGGESSLSAGATYLGSLYGISYDKKLVSVNLETGARTLIADVDDSKSYKTMAYDYTTRKMFGFSVSSTDSSVEIINLSDGSTQVVGTTDIAIFAMACASDGVLYAIAGDGNLYSVDKTTAELDLIGSTGVSAIKYLQSATINPETDEMYWAQCGNGEVNMYKVNLSTGLATLVAPLPNNSEITCLAYNPEIETYPVTINVKHATENTAISGAYIKLDGSLMDTFTDETGSITTNLIAGEYEYVVLKDNFANATGTITVVDAALTEDVAMTPGDSKWLVTFHVQDILGDIEGATIDFDGQMATTNSEGIAQMEHVSNTAVEVEVPFTATADNHLDYSGNVIVDGDVSVDVIMELSTRILTFNVKKSWGSNDVIEGANITIVNGDSVFTSLTDVLGGAEFNATPGTYTYTVTKEGFEDGVGSIELTSNKTEEVSLDEVIIDPYSLSVNIQGSDAVLTWNMSSEVITEGFEEAVPPADWTLNNTNATTWKQVGEVTFSGFPVVPQDGVSQAQLTWDYGHQDEWLITPSFTVPSGANLTFWSYNLALGSTHGDHYFVKISTDGGNSWTELWDAVESCDTTDYQKVVLDLSSHSGSEAQIAWQGVDGDGQGLWFSWFIDFITVGNAKETVSFNGELKHRSLAINRTKGTNSRKSFSRDGSNPIASSQRAKDLVNYKVFLNDLTTPAATVTENTYTFAGLTSGESYTAGVQSVFESGESTVKTIDFTMPVATTGVTLNETSLEIEQGSNATLVATVTPDNATNKNIIWSSSDDAIASVDTEGKVTGVAKGNATITATTEEGGFTATCEVTVKAIAVTGITLSQSSIEIQVGADSTLVATVTPDNATNKNVIWSSSDDAIATVDQNGEVTGVAKGNATITATTEEGGFTANCEITVIGTGIDDEDLQQITVYPNPSNGQLFVNTDGEYDMQVFDLTGKVIDTKLIIGQTTINLPKGVYFLKFNSDNKAPITRKVIVK